MRLGPSLIDLDFSHSQSDIFYLSDVSHYIDPLRDAAILTTV